MCCDSISPTVPTHSVASMSGRSPGGEEIVLKYVLNGIHSCLSVCMHVSHALVFLIQSRPAVN